jgi:nucleoid DNA-binding protein
MNTTELVIEIARISKRTRHQMTRREVAHVMKIMLHILEDQLTRPAGGVRLGRLGMLGVKRRVRRKGTSGGTLVNIHTGEKIKVPRITYRIQFQPTDGLKKKLKLRRAKHWKYLPD